MSNVSFKWEGPHYYRISILYFHLSFYLRTHVSHRIISIIESHLNLKLWSFKGIKSREHLNPNFTSCTFIIDLHFLFAQVVQINDIRLCYEACLCIHRKYACLHIINVISLFFGNAKKWVEKTEDIELL